MFSLLFSVLGPWTMEIPNCTVLSSLCVVISSMEYASLVVEPRKPSFSSKVLPYSTPESRLVGCFTAPSPNSTGLPSRQPFWSSRSTPYRVSGGSLLYQDRRLLWPNPSRHDWPIHLRLGGYESISTSAWVYAQHSPVVRSQLDGAEVVSYAAR